MVSNVLITQAAPGLSRGVRCKLSRLRLVSNDIVKPAAGLSHGLEMKKTLKVSHPCSNNMRPERGRRLHLPHWTGISRPTRPKVSGFLCVVIVSVDFNTRVSGNVIGINDSRVQKSREMS